MALCVETFPLQNLPVVSGLMKIFAAFVLFTLLGHAAETTDVPYYEHGKFTGTRKVKVTRQDGRLVKKSELIKGDDVTNVKTTGFRVAAMDPGTTNPFNLLASDILLEADGQMMTSLSAAQDFFANPAKYSAIKVLRDNKEITLTKNNN